MITVGNTEDLLAPLLTGPENDLLIIGQLGQSLDGRVATATGHSHYINTAEGLTHLHRLRAFVDAVVVGVGTVLADDPQLTVRRVEGPNPARVVIDPHGKLPVKARLLSEDGARRVIVTASDRQSVAAAGVEIVPLRVQDGSIDPAEILKALAMLGFRRVLIEGGPQTVSRFLAARCLDRLHIIVAPLLLGAGPASLTLPPVDLVQHAVRPPVRAFSLGGDVLFDCDLSAQRVPIGVAKKST
jgi:diaminohydroxyphosphoribosylaminopyrimidine deaminase/5-amino-6-(5-phosphoribosylamino)uracil reductase